MLEIAEIIEVETDETSHNLRTAHSTFTLSMLDAVRPLQSQFCYFYIKFLAEVICNETSAKLIVQNLLISSYFCTSYLCIRL